jgi:hypothetical protein
MDEGPSGEDRATAARFAERLLKTAGKEVFTTSCIFQPAGDYMLSLGKILETYSMGMRRFVADDLAEA